MAQSKLQTQDPKKRWAPAKRRTNQSRPAIRRARATKVVALRIGGNTLGEIAEEMKISVDTVKRDIEFADENGLIEQFEQRLLQELAPQAINVLARRLKDEGPLDLDAAGKVLNYMKAKSNQKAAKELKAQSAEDELNEYFARVKQDAITAEVVGQEERTGGLLGEGAPRLLSAGDLANAPERLAPVVASPDREGPREDSGVHDAAAVDRAGRTDDHLDDSAAVVSGI